MHCMNLQKVFLSCRKAHGRPSLYAWKGSYLLYMLGQAFFVQIRSRPKSSVHWCQRQAFTSCSKALGRPSFLLGRLWRQMSQGHIFFKVHLSKYPGVCFFFILSIKMPPGLGLTVYAFYVILCCEVGFCCSEWCWGGFCPYKAVNGNMNRPNFSLFRGNNGLTSKTGFRGRHVASIAGSFKLRVWIHEARLLIWIDNKQLVKKS